MRHLAQGHEFRPPGTPTTAVSRLIPLRVSETSSTGGAAASFILIVDKVETIA